MNKPIFVLFRPDNFHKAAIQFYATLKIILKEASIEWIDNYGQGDINDWQQYPSNKFIHITWHTKGYRKGRWHLKRGPLPGTIEWDFLGYAGFSSLVNKKKISFYYDDINWFESFASRYRTRKISKYKQPKKSFDFLCQNRFIFFPLQLIDDSVMKLSTHNSYEVCSITALNLHKIGIKLIAKVHPKDLLLKSYIYDNYSAALKKLSVIPGANKLLSLIECGYVKLVDCDIHDIIRDCMSVALVNSGVGMEALLYKKCVYSWAPSLYQYATFSLQEELIKEPSVRFQQIFPLESTSAMFSEIMQKHLFYIDDVPSIKRMVAYICNDWLEENFSHYYKK